MLTLLLAWNNYKFVIPKQGSAQNHPKGYLKDKTSEQNPRSAESEALGAKTRNLSLSEVPLGSVIIRMTTEHVEPLTERLFARKKE
jgi:hypothetical protein